MTIHALEGIRPSLPENGDYWVAPGAHLIGKVTIGEGVGIWFGAVLRGDCEVIEIGEGSNIQDNSVLHSDYGFPMIVGRGVTVGHRAMLHGALIGDNVLIGMGAMVMNGARIGENCLIGAGAMVTEGKEIPPGSLVLGAPGKVVRELDAAAIDGLRASAEHYRQNMRRFRDGLRSESINPAPLV